MGPNPISEDAIVSIEDPRPGLGSKALATLSFDFENLFRVAKTPSDRRRRDGRVVSAIRGQRSDVHILDKASWCGIISR